MSAPIAEEPSNTEESEASEEVKSDSDSSESEGDDSGNVSTDSAASDSDSGNYPTTDSDYGVNEKEEMPHSPALKEWKELTKDKK